MILGISGSHGAGKGAVVGILKERGFIHCSARDLILEEVKRHGLPQDRKTISDAANKLRAKYGADYIVKKYITQRDPSQEDLVIESIYTTKEAEAIRLAGGYVVAVDADPDVRYDRIRHRMSTTDFVTKEEFISFQKAEFSSEDPARQNAEQVMREADFRIENNGSLEELRIQIEEILRGLEQ